MISSRRRSRVMHAKRLAVLLVVAGASAGFVYKWNQRQVRANAGTMLELARSADAQENVADAVKLYTDYLNFQPGDVDAVGEYVHLLERTTGRRAKGVRSLADAYERLLRLDPKRTADRLKLTDLYLSLNYVAGAKSHLDALLDPARGGRTDDPDLLVRYAACEERLGRTPEAIERLRQAVATKKATGETYIRLAQLLRNETKTPAALEESERVLASLIEDKPGDLSARLAHARDLLASGKVAEASADLTAARSLADADTNPEFVALSAQLKTAEGNFNDARELLAKAVGANPKDGRLRLQLVDTLMRLNLLPQAREELKKAGDALPADGPIALDAIDRKLDLGMVAEANADVARLSGRDDYRPLTDYLTGRVRLAEGNWPAAIPPLRTALTPLERSPALASKAYVVLGRCYQAAGNPDAMLAAFTAAVKADPESVPAQIGKAEAAALLGDWPTATATFRLFAKRSPEAKGLYARYVLGEQLARPPAKRSWAEFDAALGGTPDTPDVTLIRANGLAARGDLPAADALLLQATKDRPDDPAPLAVLAVLRGNSDTTAGLALLTEADTRFGDRVELRLARARLLAKSAKGDVGKLVALADNAGGFSASDRFRLFVELGDLFAGPLDKPAEAESLYQKAAAEAPYHLPCRVALLELAMRGRDPAKVKSALDAVRELEGADGPTVRLAEVIASLSAPNPDRQRFLDARAKAADIVRSRPGWGRAHAVLAELSDATGDSESAVDHYRKAFDRGERSPAVVRQYVRLLFERTQYDEARRVLERLDQAGSLTADLRQRLALIDAATVRDPQRVVDSVKATEGSTDPAEQVFRGQALMLAGDRAGAARAFEKAVGLNPARIDGWVNLVVAYTRSGQFDLAKAAVGRAGKTFAADRGMKPAIATAFAVMADTVGDLKSAEDGYRTALRLAPHDPRATRQFVSLLLRTGRPADAVTQLREVIDGDAAESLKLYARRTLAFVLLDQPDGHRQVEAAVNLIDANLAAGDRVEDVRAKAFAVGSDPFRRGEAKRALDATAGRGPFSPEELMRRAAWFAAEGDLAAAESDLREATRTADVGNVEGLTRLHLIQLARDRQSQAAETLERMKTSGSGWPVVAADARQLAKSGKKPEALTRLLAAGESVEAKTRLVPTLVELGFLAEAEKVTRERATDAPGRFALAMFLVSTGRQADAVAYVRGLDAAFPQAFAAKVYTAAAATRPPASLPAAERATWDKTLDEIAAWATSRTDRDAVMLAAVVADVQKRYDDSIRAYESILNADPTSVAALNNVAVLSVLHGKDVGPKPGELIDRAIAAAGPRPSLLDTRAIWHLAAGRPAEAARDLEAAVVQEPKPVYRFHLALAYEKLGDSSRKLAAIDAAGKELKKEMLHPLEWPEYERLFGPMP